MTISFSLTGLISVCFADWRDSRSLTHQGRLVHSDSPRFRALCDYQKFHLWLKPGRDLRAIAFAAFFAHVYVDGHSVVSQGWLCNTSWCRTDPEAVEILASDVQLLNPLEFLNDTIIDFYIKYDHRNVNLNGITSWKFLS